MCWWKNEGHALFFPYAGESPGLEGGEVDEGGWKGPGGGEGAGSGREIPGKEGGGEKGKEKKEGGGGVTNTM